ncbi:10071_t:CDS:10 [Diversispora eburnea]|uniref:10071_t:CDS:1 n=1 Tax=Diversispora eburnea TaxID=1213867 RepID=A0A9N8Z7D1_9GLOM|nr:10071_t:CDS:10 [Diversispora eburnea]
MSLIKPSILSLNPRSSYGINTFHAVYNPKTGKTITSHPILQSIGDFFAEEKTDFDEHEGIFGHVNSFIHKTCRGAGAGGVRNWSYETIEDWFRDGIRLSKGMTHKNSLADLWWGGGKEGSTIQQRRTVFEEYGRFLSSLKGAYVAAEDLGTTEDDMASVFKKTRFITCIPPEYGGSGNPSAPTARGVVCALEAAFSYTGRDSLEDGTFAVQKKAKHILVNDIDMAKINAAEKRFDKEFKEGRITFRYTERNDHSILFEDVDAIVPCATGGILNPMTIPKIKTKIICGAANNQLSDFLANRMGIVNCADESVGHIKNDPLFEKHFSRSWMYSLYNLTKFVLSKAETSESTPQQIAIELAEKKSLETHPIFGHRGKQIIDSLINSDEWNSRIKVNEQQIESY